jgi:hypothetical protein
LWLGKSGVADSVPGRGSGAGQPHPPARKTASGKIRPQTLCKFRDRQISTLVEPDLGNVAVPHEWAFLPVGFRSLRVIYRRFLACSVSSFQRILAVFAQWNSLDAFATFLPKEFCDYGLIP